MVILIVAEGRGHTTYNLSLSLRGQGICCPRLPELWTLESFPFKINPVSRRQIRELAELEFIPKAANIIFICPTGVGKTWLASGLPLNLRSEQTNIFLALRQNLLVNRPA